MSRPGLGNRGSQQTALVPCEGIAFKGFVHDLVYGAGESTSQTSEFCHRFTLSRIEMLLMRMTSYQSPRNSNPRYLACFSSSGSLCMGLAMICLKKPRGRDACLHRCRPAAASDYWSCHALRHDFLSAAAKASMSVLGSRSSLMIALPLPAS